MAVSTGNRGIQIAFSFNASERSKHHMGKRYLLPDSYLL
jgi:hypothetical protein